MIFQAYSTVADGNMSVNWGPEPEVEVHRTKFLASHGLKRSDAVVMNLEHKDRIEVVDRSHANTYVTAEAVLTKEKGLVLMLLTADCIPMTLYDPTNEAIALAHMSWQVTSLELSKKVVLAMQKEFGTNPADLRVTIGPSARKESYIQQEVLQKSVPAWAPFLTEVPEGVSINVVGYNLAQLAEVGVSRAQVSIDSNDTISSKMYYSHYRSVRTGEPEGRFATLLELKAL